MINTKYSKEPKQNINRSIEHYNEFECPHLYAHKEVLKEIIQFIRAWDDDTAVFPALDLLSFFLF